MFKIAFIHPGYENLGIEYLSAGLKRKGFHTRLFLDPILFSESGFIDNQLLSNLFSYKKRLKNQLIDYKPDLICLSVITDNYTWACEWADEIKNLLDIPIVFGGIHPTSVPHKVITRSSIDYVCVGEGDEAIVDLAKALSENKPVDKIKNIWLKQNGEIIKNEPRALAANLDDLPFPDKDLFSRTAPVFNSGYTVLTSRGCLYSCSYCCNNVWHKIYKNEKHIFRKRGINNVIDELKRAKSEYRPKYIAFLDEVFNADRPWLGEFLDRYAKEIRLPYSCYLYPDLITEDTVKQLKKSGCKRVQMGLQVVDEAKRQNVLHRHSSQRSISQAITLFRKENIFTVCDNILGFPDEQKDELAQLAHFYRQNPVHRAEIFWLRYYPGTDIIQWSKDKGYIDDAKIEEIEAGRMKKGIAKGGDHETVPARQFMLLFYLVKFLPDSLSGYILRKKLYRFLPKLSPMTLCILERIFNRAKYDLNVSRTKARYFYFILCRIFCP